MAPPAIAPRFFDLSRRAKLRVRGGDRLRYVNGQITNDARKATPSQAIEACVLNAKGKLNAHIFLSSGPDCFWIDADENLRAALPARLERYVISDDVEIENVEAALFHVLAPSAPNLSAPGRVVSARRFVEPGWDLWLEAKDHAPAFEKLAALMPFMDEKMAEQFRIEQGIPRWGRELTEEIIPIEANLESRTIDYEKGCYIGQEVISRIKMSGQTNKRLCGLVSPGTGTGTLPAGTKLKAGGREIGWVTSSTQREGQEIALGYIKRGFNEVGQRLEVMGAQTDAAPDQVQIVPIPFQ